MSSGCCAMSGSSLSLLGITSVASPASSNRAERQVSSMYNNTPMPKDFALPRKHISSLPLKKKPCCIHSVLDLLTKSKEMNLGAWTCCAASGAKQTNSVSGETATSRAIHATEPSPDTLYLQPTACPGYKTVGSSFFL